MDAPDTPVMDAHTDWTDNIDGPWDWTDEDLEVGWKECDEMITWLYDRLLARIEEYAHWRGSELRAARSHLTRMGEKNEYDFEDSPDPNWKNRIPLTKTAEARANWTGWRMVIGTEKMRREAVAEVKTA